MGAAVTMTLPARETERSCMTVRCWLLFASLLAAGCTPFTPKPLVPEKTAAQFEQRTLADPALRSFLQTNLHRQFQEWPATTWDEDMLTLAAFYYHPSLDVARADWRVLTAGKVTAAERPNPTVTGSILHEPVPDAPSPWIPTISFDLPFETAGKRRLRAEQAQHLSESAWHNLATTEWQVRSHLHTVLLDLSANQERAALLQQQVSLHEDIVQRLQRQFEAGAISATERDVPRIALVHARADLSETQRLLAEARPRLADALGVPISALDGVRLDLTLTLSGSAEHLTTREARDLALLGRADIRAALADYAASQSALQLEVARQYPDIHLAPAYSWNAGSAGEHDWQLGATVELPLLNRHEGPIAEAEARREASAARFLALQAKAIGDIDTALASCRACQTNLTTIESLAKAQQSRREAILKQVEAGAVDRLEVLAAELELNTAQTALLEARIKLQQALAILEDAVQRPLAYWPALDQNRPGEQGEKSETRNPKSETNSK
jgi:outer membrane protein, heavy metal efflux system